jgi:hypothetical protein
MVKQKIFNEKPSLIVERQKLIHSGKVLRDDQTVADLGLAESDFIVCMLTKELAKVSYFHHQFYFIRGFWFVLLDRKLLMFSRLSNWKKTEILFLLLFPQLKNQPLFRYPN